MAQIKGGSRLLDKLQGWLDGISKGETLKVGFLQGATYPTGEPVAMVAAIQNYGAPAAGIPPRPFFSNVVAAGKKTWNKDIAKILPATDYDGKRTLELMGEKIKGEIQASITSGKFVPLKPATAKRKGFTTPLVDTSHMLNSVDFKVK